ncbi:hypothetical protein FHS39_004082 [Streptomyces olivoverticillatus]|uniref:Uncharacterized protein n=1 Tax=Streptomyces olivoverticillatus TaxID=66427 RepID=A0A7W7LRE8_9ACTN|nr:hypothetical protein [Streptomyces olivoverticillatus]MBB4895015.1 hypothetical protein [Streptomyces olivoverticillatus]
MTYNRTGKTALACLAAAALALTAAAEAGAAFPSPHRPVMTNGQAAPGGHDGRLTVAAPAFDEEDTDTPDDPAPDDDADGVPSDNEDDSGDDGGGDGSGISPTELAIVIAGTAALAATLASVATYLLTRRRRDQG